MPCYIMDKLSFILNKLFDAKMHTICYLNTNNNVKFDSNSDGKL